MHVFWLSGQTVFCFHLYSRFVSVCKPLSYLVGTKLFSWDGLWNSRIRSMARFSSSSSRSRWSSRSSSISTVPQSTYSALSGKRSPSACDEVAVRYPNGGSTVFYHSNFRASAIGRGISDEHCQWLLRAVVELSLFGEPDDSEFKLFRRSLRRECGIEVDVENGSSKNDSTCTSSAQD